MNRNETTRNATKAMNRSATITVLLSAVMIITGVPAHMRADAATDNSRAEPSRPPNELGKIMILMYHGISARESTWRRTPEGFRTDLETLHRAGYRPISLRALVTGHIPTERGKTPVVITFDDGLPEQFQWMADAGPEAGAGRLPVPDPDTAVGILTAFHEAHPDFPLEATFFLHGKRPFGQRDQVSEKLDYLIEHGMDIGNHSTKHQNLGTAPFHNATAIQRAIGRQAIFLKSLLRRHPSYEIDMFAICYGRRPRSPTLNRFLAEGRADGVPYRNIAVLNVGAGPTVSPFDAAFNPHALPRVRASEMNTNGTGMYDWLRYFEQNPDERFVSDGDPARVTYPARAHRPLNTSILESQGLSVAR